MCLEVLRIRAFFSGHRPLLTHWPCALLFVLCGTASAQTGQIGVQIIPGHTAVQEQLRPLSITVNDQPAGDWLVLDRDGGLYAASEMFRSWRLQKPADNTAVSYKEQSWWPLFALPGYRASFDFNNQSMALCFAPQAFENTRLADARPVAPRVSPAMPAVFLNYDLSHTLAHSAGDNTFHDTGALTELGLPLGSGTLISSQLGRNLSGTNAQTSTNTLARWQRLETTWTRDFLDERLTLRLGDTQTRAAMWGRAVYFGGLQIGSNFGLTPGFMSQPIPTLSGTASSPGTLELYINNALRQTSQVPAGPFTIENFSPLTNAGEARVVVRDVLGRETVVVQPFFSNSRLLEKGLADWNLSLGRARYNLGVRADDYREGFVSGLYRRGMSPGLTLEGRADGSRHMKSGGLGLSSALPYSTLGQASVVLSHDDTAGQGAKVLLGLEQQNLRSGFNARMVASQKNYRELGFGTDERPYRYEQLLSYRLTLDNMASVGLSAARLVAHDKGSNGLLTLSYSMQLAGRGSLIFSGTRVSGNTTGHTLGVSLLLPLERRKTVSASLNKSATGWDGYAATAQSVPYEGGHGWRVLAGHQNGEPHAEAGYDFLNDKAWLAANTSVTGNAQTLRLNAQGALVAADGSVFASRRLQDSFALVEVKGYPGIGVGFLGEPLTHTDASGRALLPRLVPHQNNPVRLDANDLPFSAELDNLEQIAVPGWRSGVKVSFPVRSGRGALLRIELDDGLPAPAGARIELAGDDKTFLVGRRGEAFVTGLQAQNALQLHWNERVCSLQVNLAPGQTDDIPRIGPVPCLGVTR